MYIKKERAFNIVFISVCILLACILGIGIYALPYRNFSEAENRALASPPKIRWKSIVSGDFFDGLSAFYSDQIPFRASMIQTKARCELLLGKKENNSVMFLKNGRLAQRGIYEDHSLLEQNVLKANKLKTESGTVLALIPRSVDVYVGGEECERVRNTVGFLPLLDILRNVGDEAYYKTDHHLDASGVFAVYRHIMQELGELPLSEKEFDLTEVGSGFVGSAYSKGGLVSSVSDTVSAWRYAADADLEVNCLDEGCSLCSLYVPEEIESKDKYRYFLGGNHGVISIDSNDGAERERLFIIKDSFANAVIPLLARHFDLTVWDPRYSSSPPQIELETTRTVVICGVDTLATTKDFIKY